MAEVRHPFLGVWNIVRFNWHFYAGGLVLGILAILLATNWNSDLRYFVWIGVAGAAIQIAVSLFVSHLVYDRSGLYALSILDEWIPESARKILNIHAGFDETSGILKEKFPIGEVQIWDFYDREHHTEVSIRRARAAYPPSPEQVAISTNQLPMENETADLVCLLLAAHEIRDREERVLFLREVRRILRNDGSVVMIEHLRDLPNSLAFSLGFFHFYSRSQWRGVVKDAGFEIRDERKITPFLSAFLIRKK